MSERVLIVEDDPSLRESLALLLGRNGFSTSAVATGDDAMAVAEGPMPYDVVLLDLMLPGASGLDVCRSIRKVHATPIVMLTARTDTADVVAGLETGADDYVTKPFEPPELIARLRAVLRRVDGNTTTMITAGDLEIDIAAGEARRGGTPLPLSRTEFRLLAEMARRPRVVLSRGDLLELVWSYDYLGDSRLVDVAVSRLRTKLDDPTGSRYITTVRGLGYRFEAP
jgi:two-component system response regulator MtrA